MSVLIFTQIFPSLLFHMDVFYFECRNYNRLMFSTFKCTVLGLVPWKFELKKDYYVSIILVWWYFVLTRNYSNIFCQEAQEGAYPTHAGWLKITLKRLTRLVYKTNKHYNQTDNKSWTIMFLLIRNKARTLWNTYEGKLQN